MEIVDSVVCIKQYIQALGYKIVSDKSALFCLFLYLSQTLIAT